jgi:hypothetical protein
MPLLESHVPDDSIRLLPPPVVIMSQTVSIKNGPAAPVKIARGDYRQRAGRRPNVDEMMSRWISLVPA